MCQNPDTVNGWGYGFEPDEKEQGLHWWPTRLSREEAKTECRRELSWLGKPLYVQKWRVDEEGQRKKTGTPTPITPIKQ